MLVCRFLVLLAVVLSICLTDEDLWFFDLHYILFRVNFDEEEGDIYCMK